MTISYFIWNGDPEIFSFGSFALRWYGLLFALGFLISQQILYWIYREEGKPQKDVDTLTIYMVVATVLGARLGHVIFYQPELFWTNPLGIILPFELQPKFRFTGLQGLASHGGAFGILFALWLYSRKKKPGQSYLQVLDRIVILVALTGALIRLGNYFNSEIIGKPTDSPLAVVFVNKITESIMDHNADNSVETLQITKDTSLPAGAHGRVPINMYFFFKPGMAESQVRGFLIGDVKFYLNRLSEFVDEPGSQPLRYEITQEKNGAYGARVRTFGIARHPAQLYESFSCLALFVFLLWMWKRTKANTPPGRIFGFFLVILWSLRFVYEFLKENQVDFENNLSINMGQILSIPLIIAGIFVLVRSYRKAPEQLGNPETGKIS
jgi:phosphatidylglycerol:prolipoprotein diacylglycerol transferase